jgi:hypothetical protein
MSNNNNNSNNKSGKFPTVGLKSLLQNSDLLDILLKPLSDEKTDNQNLNITSPSALINNPVNNSSNNNEPILDLENIIDEKTKNLFDDFDLNGDYLDCKFRIPFFLKIIFKMYC